MKKFLPILVIAVLLAVGFTVWWYNTDFLPEKNVGDSSGTPAPGEEDVPETVVGEGMVEVTVEGDEYSFSPATITVEEGKTVKLTFKNIGNVSHTWTIDVLNVDSGLVLPGRSQTVEFDAVGVGTYKIYCAVSGHEGVGMVGTLVVE
jgi:plastocyanin